MVTLTSLLSSVTDARADRPQIFITRVLNGADTQRMERLRRMT